MNRRFIGPLVVDEQRNIKLPAEVAAKPSQVLGVFQEGVREMVRNRYEDFAERYNMFFDKFGQHDPAYAEFFRSLFARNQVRRVLDCACGIGQDLHLSG